MSDKIEADVEAFKELSVMAPNAVTTPIEGVAAIALSMAMKFHDINTVQDGVLYQQYKMEGKNLTPLYLDVVFDTAMRIEAHLLRAPERFVKVLTEALEAGVIEEAPEGHGDAGSDDEEESPAT